MTEQEILSRCDHTLLKQNATWSQIQELCDDGIRFHCASVCIPAAYVKEAAKYVGDKLKVCTVIGFPNGYSTTAVKVFETEDAIRGGADEIDMVVNIGWVKDGQWDKLLTEEEKIKLCEIVTESGADYIKTSTGFSTAGATREDVKLFKEHVGPGVKIKAAGGIATLQDAEDFIALGADRLGTSRIVKLVKGEQGEGY